MVQRYCTLQLALRLVVLFQAICAFASDTRSNDHTLISEFYFWDTWKFQANSFHRSFLEGRCQVSSQALIPTLTQSTCNAAAALQKCEQVEQWKLIGCMSCGKWWKCGKWMEIIVCYFVCCSCFNVSCLAAWNKRCGRPIDSKANTPYVCIAMCFVAIKNRLPLWNFVPHCQRGGEDLHCQPGNTVPHWVFAC